jgi:hypothetical protein
VRRPAKRFTCPVVGVTFIGDYPDNLHDLARIQRRREQRQNEEPLVAILIRNPENKHDANAIEVHQPSVGMIGHLPRQVAERLAPCLDAGETWHATLEPVRISPEAPEQPGVNVHVERIEEDR